MTSATFAGYRAVELVLGRLLLLDGLALALVVAVAALMVAVSHPPRPDALRLALALTGDIATALAARPGHPASVRGCPA